MNAPDSPPLKRTPLFDCHKALHGKLVPFGGWEMPVQYSGLVDEHIAVRTKAGLFDVSHMGEIRVKGPKAFEVVQRITCNDVAVLVDGRIQYSAFLTEKGTFVDDLLTYRLAADDYLLVVNASNTPKDVAWAKSFAVAGVTIEDESPAWSQIAIQGPLSQEILQPFVKADLAKVAYYWFTWADVLGTRCIVSRTGYTGEDGFEVYGPAEAAPRIWNALIEAGGPKGLLPAGLGARDTLRLEAKLALYGNDIDDTVTPWEADLGWIVKMKKGDFVGRDALVRQKEHGLTKRLAGFLVEGRGIARHGYPLKVEGTREAGVVTSGTQTPTVGRALGLAYVPLAASVVGTRLLVDVRGKDVPAIVVPTPFYKRPTA
jgi:aminomethyltransferase